MNATAFDVNPAGDVAAGEQFFFGKGQCGSCHMVAGRGRHQRPGSLEHRQATDIAAIDQALVDPSPGSQIDRPRLVQDGHGVPTMAGPWSTCDCETARRSEALRGIRESTIFSCRRSMAGMHLLQDTEYIEIKREAKSIMPR